MHDDTPPQNEPGSTDGSAPAVRLIVQQPALAKYRVPVFRLLANQPNIDLRLLYGAVPELPNVPAAGFDAEPVLLQEWNLLGSPLYWHSAQWHSATRGQADVLMLTWNVRYLSLVPALLRAKLSGVPTILWGHAYSKTESTSRRFLRKTISRLATALLFYNEQAAEAYRSEGWPQDRLYVAPNSLDQAPIRNARASWESRPEDLVAFRKEHDLEEGPVVLYVSRFETANRVDLLIAAAEQLSREYPKLRVLLIGKSNEEQVRLKELVRLANLGDHVQFLGAIYDEQELAPWFLSADVFCYPANIGLSLLHAFGYGLPVVTGDDLASHNPEIEALANGVNGLLFRHGDAGSLAAALRKLFEDKPLAQRMSAAAEHSIENRFNLEKMVAGMVAAVDYCVQRSPRQDSTQ